MRRKRGEERTKRRKEKKEVYDEMVERERKREGTEGEGKRKEKATQYGWRRADQ